MCTDEGEMITGSVELLASDAWSGNEPFDQLLLFDSFPPPALAIH